MKRAGIITILACAFALCLVLVGCGGGGSASKDAFLGTWSIDSIESDNPENVISSDDIAMMRSMNMDVTLTFNEDDTFSLNLFGETMTGTWEAKTDTTATATLEGQNVDVEIGDTGMLLFSQEGDRMIFAKGGTAAADTTTGNTDANADANGTSTDAADATDATATEGADAAAATDETAESTEAETQEAA